MHTHDPINVIYSFFFFFPAFEFMPVCAGKQIFCKCWILSRSTDSLVKKKKQQQKPLVLAVSFLYSTRPPLHLENTALKQCIFHPLCFLQDYFYRCSLAPVPAFIYLSVCLSAYLNQEHNLLSYLWSNDSLHSLLYSSTLSCGQCCTNSFLVIISLKLISWVC